MHTKKMLNKFKGEVSSVLSKVAGKAEHVAKISKLKLEISSRKSEINSSYQEIGEYVFNKKKEYTKDSFISDVFNGIEDLILKNENAKKAIDEIKLSAKEESKKKEKEPIKPEE